MFKKLLAFFAAMYMAVSFAAVDVNKATPAELDGLKGIGPAISGKIVDERKKGEFKDWNDFIARVKGVGEQNATQFSAEGMTVGGASYKGAAPVAKKDEKPAAKAEEKKPETKPAAAAVAAAPAAAAATAKDEAKMKADEAKAKKDADKKTKADEKKQKAEEAKAKAAADKAAKSDAKKAKSSAKADSAKPAASAAK